MPLAALYTGCSAGPGVHCARRSQVRRPRGVVSGCMGVRIVESRGLRGGGGTQIGRVSINCNILMTKCRMVVQVLFYKVVP